MNSKIKPKNCSKLDKLYKFLQNHVPVCAIPLRTANVRPPT